MDRTELAFMIQEVISEAQARPEGAEMIDLIDKYEKYCSPSCLVPLDEFKCGDKIMQVIMNNWDGGAVNPAELFAKIMRVISKFSQPSRVRELEEALEKIANMPILETSFGHLKGIAKQALANKKEKI